MHGALLWLSLQRVELINLKGIGRLQPMQDAKRDAEGLRYFFKEAAGVDEIYFFAEAASIGR